MAVLFLCLAKTVCNSLLSIAPVYIKPIDRRLSYKSTGIPSWESSSVVHLNGFAARHGVCLSTGISSREVSLEVVLFNFAC